MISKETLKNIIFCIITALLTVCAFPKINLFFLIWISIVPLIFVIFKSDVKKSFLYGFLTGFIFNAAGLYWLIPMLHFNTRSYLQAIPAACALWIYLALYWAVWSVCLSFLKSKFENIKYFSVFTIFFSACIWVLLEYIRTYFLTGFPWMLIGYSQFAFTEIIQIAEFTGVYGVSFLIIFCNLCFYFWISMQKGNKYLYISLAFIIAVSILGVFRVDKFRFFGDKKFTVAIVQPNVDQYKKWDKLYKDAILSNLKKYASEISKTKADMVLWPETAFVGYIPEDTWVFSRAEHIINTAGGFNIIGAPYSDENGKSFNAVFAFESKKGKYQCNHQNIHKKNHLVPFGEYVPFRPLLSNFFGVLNTMGDFNKGTDENVFDNGEIFVGATICSENFFPEISRRFVLSGAKVLSNHTNDAWFFDTAAAYQHFMMNIFRAVENRKAVIVSANSGISGIVEASGIIIKKTSLSKSALLTGSFLQNDFKTFYTKRGDLFIYVCSVLLVLLLSGMCLLLLKERYFKHKSSFSGQ